MTTSGPAAEPLIRVEKGAPDPDELAALTVALLARAAGHEPAPETAADRPVARWQHVETTARRRAPRSWRAGGTR